MSLTITKFQVNDQTLAVGFKIINDTDHDVWILESIDFLESGFESYVTEDDRTLLIRRRLDVPTIAIWMGAPYGWYSRLRPGEKWIETLKLDLPVIPSWLFPVPMSDAEYAQRIVLEVGCHTKNLPQMVSRSEERYPDPDIVDLVGIWYYDDQANTGEHILQITIDGVYIPNRAGRTD